MSEDRTHPTRSHGEPVRDLRASVLRGSAAVPAVEGKDSLTIGSASSNDLVIDERSVSRFHVELRRSGDRIAVTDLGSTNGTEIDRVLLRDATVAVLPGTRIRLGQAEVLVDETETRTAAFEPLPASGSLVARSPAMQRVVRAVDGLAQQDASVLLLGESGVGKEVVARALHERGKRASGPFVTVDCGAIASSLFASELFGHEKGAFTGAHTRHHGAFERAEGGTLFVDEIGELPIDLQPALLGALERRRIRRLGGRDDLPIDVRLVCATHRDLRAEVNRGAFRLDLYYRLAVVLLRVPPLRERIEDLAPLVERFLSEEANVQRPASELFTKDAWAAMRSHRWPGNVRELRNVVIAALATGEAPSLDTAEDAMPIGDRVLERPYREAKRLVTDAFEARYVRGLLERTGGNVREAARVARMDRSYLLDLIKRHGRGDDDGGA